MAGEPLVLVVEDEPAQREVLAYNIRAEGYEVVTAEAGDEALVIVRETPPDVIILDWMLPNVSGIEVCRQLKMSGDTARIPVIMLSARSEETDKVRGLETGADDYVIKPYSVAELLARLRTQLRRIRPAAVGERLEFEDIVVGPRRAPRLSRRRQPQPRAHRVPPADRLHGASGAGLEPRAAARPGLGP